MRPLVPAVLTALAVPLLLTGCRAADQPEALAAGNAFQSALLRGDAGTACGLLSEESRHRLESASAQPCTAVLLQRSLPTGPATSAEVWGGNAQLRLGSGVVFLARFGSGWRVTAAGCRPRPNQPYDCTVAS